MLVETDLGVGNQLEKLVESPLRSEYRKDSWKTNLQQDILSSLLRHWSCHFFLHLPCKINKPHVALDTFPHYSGNWVLLQVIGVHYLIHNRFLDLWNLYYQTNNSNTYNKNENHHLSCWKAINDRAVIINTGHLSNNLKEMRDLATSQRRFQQKSLPVKILQARTQPKASGSAWRTVWPKEGEKGRGNYDMRTEAKDHSQ